MTDEQRITLAVALVVGVMMAVTIWQCIKATRNPPRNRRVNLPPPTKDCTRSYADV